MNANLQSAAYTRTAVWLHWIVGGATIGMLILGFYMLRVPPNTPARGALLNLHKSTGMLLLALICARIAWRLTEPPPLPAVLPPWQRQAAILVHAALYVLLLVQPLTGYATAAFGVFGVRVFGWELPALFAANPAARATFAAMHHASAAAFAALIALHIFAAVRNGRRGPEGWQRMRLKRLA